jgi:hypothetical protein
LAWNKSIEEGQQKIRSFPFHLIHCRNQGKVKSHSGLTWVHFGLYMITFWIDNSKEQAGSGTLVELPYSEIQKLSLSPKEHRIRIFFKTITTISDIEYFGIDVSF